MNYNCRNRSSFLLAGVLMAAPLAAAAQSAPDIRRFEPERASPASPPDSPARAAAVAPDVRSYAPTFASPGVPMSAPGTRWTPRNDGSTASAGVPMREAPAGDAVASAQRPATR